MDPQLRKLIAERGVVKASLTRLKTFVNDNMKSTPIINVKNRLDYYRPLIDKFMKLQDQIDIAVTGTDMETSQGDERDQFTELYFDVISEIDSHIAAVAPDNKGEIAPSSGSATSPMFAQSHQHMLKLPTIHLPSFDGNYNDWIKFRDSFLDLVHQNNSLSDIQRFHYLSSTLHGPAARVIQTLGISEANYKIAWETLRARYDNSSALRRHHLNALLDMTPIHQQSPRSIREFIDDVNNHFAALKSLGEPVEHWDSMALAILSRKLDPSAIRDWERRASSSTHHTRLRDLIDFLEERSRYLENIAVTRQVNGNSSSIARRPEKPTAHVVNTMITCPVCSENHRAYQCNQFKELDLNKRREIVRKARICFNCLAGGHQANSCISGHCKLCKNKHHTLLHPDTTQTTSADTTPCEFSQENSNSRSRHYVANNASDCTTQAVLSTAIVFIRDCHGQKRECRVLLDSGSQAHFITKDYCKKLGLKIAPTNSTVTGIGRATNAITGTTQIEISSRYNNFRARVSCLTINTITADIPNVPLSPQHLNLSHPLQLADPLFYQCRRIDMLIGAGLFWDLLCIGQHRVNTRLILQKTQLGWVLGGQYPMTGQRNPTTCHSTTDQELYTQVKKFWEIEEPAPRADTKIDKCEQHFITTTQRDPTGRYVVSIPFKETKADLGDSREQAKSRFLTLERKLSKNASLREQYVAFLGEYEQLGHMTRLQEPINNSLPAYYLPHHAVTKDNSTTTKIRVVFDGSAKTTSGVSLNEVQLVGPTIQSDLFSILIRFRQHKYVLSADIEKMYRQVLVNPSDRRFQRILWRPNSSSPIQTYELNTVTYGTASAPFLATRVLHDIGTQCASTSSRTSQVILTDFYVDDLLTGAETIAQAQALKQELTTTLAQHGFRLRKWASNHYDILHQDTTPRDRIQIPADKDPKTLGLLWSPTTDTLEFKITPTSNHRITKRTILSDVARIFDPLGLLGPITITAKIILQRLWQLKSGWDESIPQDLHTQWTEYRKTLQDMQILSIPRRVLLHNRNTRTEMHGFSDASEQAYGACIYIRCEEHTGKWTIRLLCAKSRVAPLKTISLPRLELCGAVLLANLLHKSRSALRGVAAKEYLWTDSTVTLAWLRGPPTKWKTFVANRVAEVQSITDPDTWRHISSEDNPADLISRGVQPKRLLDTHLWWAGPNWLTKPETMWPSSSDQPTHPPEERLLPVTTLLTIDSSFISKISNFTRLIRVTAYCLRFANKARKTRPRPASESHGALTTTELRHAEMALAKLTQSEHFQSEVQALRKNLPLPRSSPLLSLGVFLDNDGLIRVGGRLKNANITYNKKHQILLPAQHHFTKLLVIHEHMRLMHAGPQQVTSSLRERYWPLRCTNLVKKIIRTCVRCFKVQPRSSNLQMGQLPASRITPARAFSSCGVDYAGPYFLKQGIRSKVRTKAYLCIFVCLVTKAVHLELSTDLSTDAFLNCFRRFIARRGRCQRILSDNGRNFVGARNALKELGMLLHNTEHNRQIADFLHKDGIVWQLNPPHAPHFGGIWESAVKSTKHHLKRVIGEQHLTFEELYTLLTQIESCLNSRPLTPLSSDPEDLNPLTPGHFLIGDALTALPHMNLRDIHTTRLGRYQLIQHMLQHFWQRWQKEYLHHLQQHYKWRNAAPAHIITKDMLVVVREDNLPPLKWQLARVIELHPGTDGITRVATIRTAEGIVKRPVTKLCVLPIEDQN